MTFTGLIRGVDRLGRVVLPKKLRTALNINELIDPLEIYLSDGFIILSKVTDFSTLPRGDRRCLDNFGRIVIPAEIRSHLGIESQVDMVEIYSDEENIILKKHEPNCIFCGSSHAAVIFKEKNICDDCLNQLKNL